MIRDCQGRESEVSLDSDRLCLLGRVGWTEGFQR